MNNTKVFPVQKANRLTCRWVPTTSGSMQCVWTLGSSRPSRMTSAPSREAESQAVRQCA
jgi:hypothetical protein